jgi:hypothetical protein
MAENHHETLLPMLTSFVHGEDLWIVIPFIDNGSVFSILRCCTEPPAVCVQEHVLVGVMILKHRNTACRMHHTAM